MHAAFLAFALSWQHACMYVCCTLGGGWDLLISLYMLSSIFQKCMALFENYPTFFAGSLDKMERPSPGSFMFALCLLELLLEDMCLPSK